MRNLIHSKIHPYIKEHIHNIECCINSRVGVRLCGFLGFSIREKNRNQIMVQITEPLHNYNLSVVLLEHE